MSTTPNGIPTKAMWDEYDEQMITHAREVLSKNTWDELNEVFGWGGKALTKEEIIIEIIHAEFGEPASCSQFIIDQFKKEGLI